MIGEWNCEGYTMELKVGMMNLTSKVWASEDVKVSGDAREAIATVMFATQIDSASKIAEFAKIKGYRVYQESTVSIMGTEIKANTFFLFQEEYKVPLLPPDLAAYFATYAEHIFSVLLVIGLASRLSALGLMIMTLVIQIFVYPSGWPEHILWFACLLLIVARGPGAISLDHLFWARTKGNR